MSWLTSNHRNLIFLAIRHCECFPVSGKKHDKFAKSNTFLAEEYKELDSYPPYFYRLSKVNLMRPLIHFKLRKIDYALLRISFHGWNWCSKRTMNQKITRCSNWPVPPSVYCKQSSWCYYLVVSVWSPPQLSQASPEFWTQSSHCNLASIKFKRAQYLKWLQSHFEPVIYAKIQYNEHQNSAQSLTALSKSNQWLHWLSGLATSD